MPPTVVLQDQTMQTLDSPKTLNAIPPMTDPRGRCWEQPRTELILIDEEWIARECGEIFSG
jgi:hypothetical protein